MANSAPNPMKPSKFEGEMACLTVDILPDIQAVNIRSQYSIKLR